MTRPLVALGVTALLVLAVALAVVLSLPATERASGAAMPAARGAGETAGGRAGGYASDAELASASDAAGVAEVGAIATRMAAGPSAPPWSARVVDARDGSPIAAAELTLTRGQHAVSATTDSNGCATLAFARGADGTLSVRHVGYVDLLLAEPDLSHDGLFALEPSGSIRGVVLGPGATSPEALSIGLWADRRDRYEGAPLRETRPDAAGDFRFDDISPGAYALGAYGGERPLAFRNGLLVRSAIETYASIEVDSGLALRGRVLVGKDRRPLEGAHVVVLPEVQGINDSVERLGERVATAGTDGRFEVTGLGQGGHDVNVRAPWSATLHRREDLSIHTHLTERAFVLREPASVSGVVREPSGALAPDALVALAARGDSERLEHGAALKAVASEEPGALLATRTDATGSFAFERAPGGETLHLIAWPAGFDPERPSAHLPGGARLRDVPAGGAVEDVELVLLEGASLRGRVVDREGRGLPGAEVRLDVALGGPPRRVYSAVAGAGGAFQFPSVPWDVSRLRVRLAGYRGASPDLAGRVPDEELVVTLYPDAAVRGRVVDGEDRAVPGASVRLTRGRRQSRSDRADEFGRFEIFGLEPGTWRASVNAPGFELPGDGPPTVDVPMADELVFRLDALDPRAPVAVAGEVVDAETGGPVPNLRLRGHLGGVVHIEGTRFRVEGMQPGEARLRAGSEGYEEAVWPVRDYLPGEAVELGLLEVWRIGTLVVRVRDKADRPLRRAAVRLRPLPRGQGGTGAGRPPQALEELRRSDGRYVAGAPRRSFELEVSRRGFRTHSETISVEGERTDVTVRLEREAATAGD